MVGPGDEVPGGASNRDGALVVQAKASAGDSTPARIAQLAKDAQSRKPKAQRWVDKFGEAYSKVRRADEEKGWEWIAQGDGGRDVAAP